MRALNLMILVLALSMNGLSLGQVTNATEPQYQLRAGDTLMLDFRLSPELNQTVIVDRDGSISLQIIGRVQVAGLTLDRAKALILEKESTHLVRPELNLSLTDFQHFYVVVAGEVYLPQKLEIREDMTALQAIMLSGGVKNTGSQTQVLLYRKVNSEYAEVHPLNLRIRKTVELEQDMPLMPGDLILVRRSKVESVTRYTRIVGLNYNIVPQAY
jgi:protein involved in polysaccharide export with SLBB domain